MKLASDSPLVRRFRGVLYHGTSKDYDVPKPARGLGGVLWLTTSRAAAAQYAVPYYARSAIFAYLWKIKLRPGARIVDLSDLSDPVSAGFREAWNESRSHLGFPISEADWTAEFGMFEAGSGWVTKYLRSRKVDGAIVRDALGSTGVFHHSLALVHASAIDSLEREVIPAASVRGKTIGEIAAEIGEEK